jgi:hypothetical protein
MEIEVAFNFIYIMHYNGLVIFSTSLQLSTYVHELNHSLYLC